MSNSFLTVTLLFLLQPCISLMQVSHNPVGNWKQVGDSCEYGLCENPENYPEDVINGLLTPELKAFFGNVISPVPKDQTDGTRSFGDTLCPSSFKAFYPRKSRSMGPGKYIVNSGNFTQKIVFDVCKDPNNSCFDSEMERILPFATYCSQKYSFVYVITLSEDGKSFEKSQIKVPTSCVCKIKYID